MKLQDLRQQLLSLPASQRALLARELWNSLDEADKSEEDTEVVTEAIRRNREMVEGSVVGRSHEEVMIALRKRLA